jgi:flagellar biosynthesis/type III secretory pathway M-ring protein FliF/YscJ
MDIFEQEAHELEEQITEEAQKREQKRDKIGQLAKQKPERFAAALQKWLFKNSET